MTFIHVDSKHSIVRWLPFNFLTDEGTGYNKFSSGDLFYGSRFKYIEVQFQPLQGIKNTKSSVSKTQYSLYVSDDS